MQGLAGLVCGSSALAGCFSSHSGLPHTLVQSQVRSVISASHLWAFWMKLSPLGGGRCWQPCLRDMHKFNTFLKVPPT